MLKNKYFKVILSTMLVVTMLVCSNIVAFAADTTSSARSVDSMLLKSQQWLNENFSSNSAFGSVPEDGTSRRATVNGCIRALQIRLGIVNTADNFGQGTESLFKSTYKNGIVQQEYPSTEEDKVYGIIQCALWTKGYSTGSSSITKHFYDGTGNVVKALKRDLGISSDSSTVTLNVMKFLLSMKQSKKVSGGIDDIRTIQQRLNNRYEPYIGFIPTDGSMTRETSKALIIALQITEDIDPSLATGNFGKTTKERLPVLPDTINSLSSEKKNEFVDLIRYSLCANGIQVSLDTSEWNTEVSDAIGEFQQLMELPYNKKADVNTWMSLFLSSGNPDRSSVASDTRFEMTSARIEYLKENGISIVGRYLTGDSKSLRPGEAQRLLNAGIRFFPIFQETYYSDDVTKYNYNLGVSDARKAISKARQYGIPAGNIIYFAIDFDPTQDQIDTYVVPYFQAIKENIGEYCVGVYGTRNVCWNLINIAKASFVSDMSTGYSGNKGFKMPRNWNFDQFSEIKGIGTTKWDLDKTAYSGLYPPVTSLNSGTLNLSSTFSFNDGHVGDTRHLWGNYLTLKFTATDPNPNSEPGTGSTGSIIQVQLSYEKDGELIIGPVIEVEVDGNSVTLDKYLLGGMDRKDLTLSYVNTNRNNAQVNMKVDFYNWYEAS